MSSVITHRRLVPSRERSQVPGTSAILSGRLRATAGGMAGAGIGAAASCAGAGAMPATEAISSAARR